MANYYEGQIFIDEYPVDCADWCNEGGKYHIDEISELEGHRRFQIVKNHQPTPEEKKEQEILDIKEQLRQVDEKSIRALRDGDTDYIEKYKQEAQELRDRLHELGA